MVTNSSVSSNAGISDANGSDVPDKVILDLINSFAEPESHCPH
jgi:hypothetical protein